MLTDDEIVVELECCGVEISMRGIFSYFEVVVNFDRVDVVGIFF
jgi:hypothetical protein